MALFRRRRSSGDETRIPRKDRRGASPALVGLLVLLLLAVLTFFGFTKAIPFTEGFRINAVVENTSNIRPNSPVRIAGVNVGRVTAIQPYDGDTDMSVVEMEIDEAGLPIHKDARLRIRPRIFLEGNFFVDLQPGTPSSPELSDGDTLEVTQASRAVQLDEVLTALQSDTREDLQTVLGEFGRALEGDPSESDEGQDPSVRGETAAESLNDTLADSAPALRGAAIVQEAFLGEEEDDLSSAIRGLQRVTSALGRNEGQLQDLVVNFNRTMAIFADEQDNVSATFRELAPTLATADRALASLNSSFPATRAFAREILPGVRETAPTIEASFPFIRQTRGLLRPEELQGLARDLRPTAEDLSRATDAAIEFFPEQTLASRCLTRVILPTGDIVIQDGPFSTGVENYKEFWFTMVALAGESQNFDGNGQYVRFQPGGGTQTLSTGTSNAGSPAQFFNLATPPIGTRPRYPGRRPPYRPDVPCHTQRIPDVNSAVTGPPDGGQGAAAGGPGGPPPGQQPSPLVPGVTIPNLPGAIPQIPGVNAPATAASRRRDAQNRRRAATRGRQGTASRRGRAPQRRRTIAQDLVGALNPWPSDRRSREAGR
jgi:phospholipid/cholesterol/gamma-HCH transport system substrate-binding protein